MRISCWNQPWCVSVNYLPTNEITNLQTALTLQKSNLIMIHLRVSAFQLQWVWRKSSRAWWTTTWWTVNEWVRPTTTGLSPARPCTCASRNWRSCRNRWGLSVLHRPNTAAFPLLFRVKAVLGGENAFYFPRMPFLL